MELSYDAKKGWITLTQNGSVILRATRPGDFGAAIFETKQNITMHVTHYMVNITVMPLFKADAIKRYAIDIDSELARTPFITLGDPREGGSRVGFYVLLAIVSTGYICVSLFYFWSVRN